MLARARLSYQAHTFITHMMLPASRSRVTEPSGMIFISASDCLSIRLRVLRVGSPSFRSFGVGSQPAEHVQFWFLTACGQVFGLRSPEHYAFSLEDLSIPSASSVTTKRRNRPATEICPN